MNIKVSKGLKNVLQVVMVRHGESIWNLENRFTGWQNVGLSAQGVKESLEAGRRLKEQGFKFDMCYTSVLKRAINCFNNIAESMDMHHIPVYKSYRLNERHYGALEGLNKSETAAKHGEAQVRIWRRSYDIPPPKMELEDPRAPHNNPMYDRLPRNALPFSEVRSGALYSFVVSEGYGGARDSVLAGPDLPTDHRRQEGHHHCPRQLYPRHHEVPRQYQRERLVPAI